MILKARDCNKTKMAEPPNILGENDLVVEMTKLGWIISGGANKIPPYEENTFFLSCEDQFQEINRLNLLGITDSDDNDSDFHKKFMDGLTKNESGRYVAQLPWKQGIVDLKKIIRN